MTVISVGGLDNHEYEYIEKYKKSETAEDDLVITACPAEDDLVITACPAEDDLVITACPAEDDLVITACPAYATTSALKFNENNNKRMII